jgi:multidrug efflux pump subunit AcrA (membrane-fusion protein)
LDYKKMSCFGAWGFPNRFSRLCKESLALDRFPNAPIPTHLYKVSNLMSTVPRHSWWFILIIMFVAGCGSDSSDKAAPARPVSFVVLKQSNPARLTRLTGSVESWKKEMLSFRVAGRVENVVEPGIDIEGRILGDDGEILDEGTLIASLGTSRYIVRRDEATARVELAKAQATEARTELERAIPERIKAATADEERKRSEFIRQEQLLTKNATSQTRFEQAKNELAQSESALAQAKAEQATKTAELAALVAQINQYTQQLNEAELNLNYCQLFSPFTGQISKVHAIAGSYLQEGMPVVTVQMMDPVKVEIAVSQDTDRRLRYNDQLNVYFPDSDEPINGFVYLKDTVADAATRTFNVTILVRNRRVEVGLPEQYQGQDLHRTTDLYNLESEKADGKPPFYTEEATIHTSSEGQTFVWKVEGITVADLRGSFEPVFTVKRVNVGLGEKRLPILQVYRGRELSDLGGLDPSKDLVTGKLPDGVQDGDRVFLSRREWLLRPGQLVSVELKGETVKSGFYVPRPAILRTDGKHYVFIAEDSGSGEELAKRVEVKIDELIGDYRRIEAVQEGRLGDGTKLILDGAHYLRDGDSVNAFEEVEVSL